MLEVELIIAVTPYFYDAGEIPMLTFYPQVLHLGIGCRKGSNPDGIVDFIEQKIKKQGLSPLALASVGTIELEKDEPLLKELCKNILI